MAPCPSCAPSQPRSTVELGSMEQSVLHNPSFRFPPTFSGGMSPRFAVQPRSARRRHRPQTSTNLPQTTDRVLPPLPLWPPDPPYTTDHRASMYNDVAPHGVIVGGTTQARTSGTGVSANSQRVAGEVRTGNGGHGLSSRPSTATLGKPLGGVCEKTRTPGVLR